MILVKFDYEYYNIKGFSLFKEDAWEKFKKDAQAYFEQNKAATFMYLDNYEVVWTSLDEFMYCYKTKKISNSDASTLARLLDYPYGHFPILTP